jgi:SAM-dependent methyltransferase
MGHYTTGFGEQWKTYARTQLDSYTGRPISRDRLERCLGAPVETLKGQRVLEVGAGAGRFTELLLGAGAVLTSMDASAAVHANRANCEHLGPYRLLRGDVNASPLDPRSFDVVICLGVIQHTPSPEVTLASLARHVKPGGLLVIDHYTFQRRWTWLGAKLTLAYPLREILRRVSRRRPDLALRATMAITAICDPIRKRTCRYPRLDQVAGRLFPSICYYATYPELPRSVIYAWNELDTHDGLTDWYKHRRTPEQIRATLIGLGLHDVECFLAGNGVEARARLAASYFPVQKWTLTSSEGARSRF